MAPLSSHQEAGVGEVSHFDAALVKIMTESKPREGDKPFQVTKVVGPVGVVCEREEVAS